MAGSIFIPLKAIFDNKGIKDAQSAFGKLGKSIKGGLAAAGVGLSLGAITQRLGAAIQAAEKVQKSNARLEQVAKSMNLFGNATSVATQRLRDYADTLERSTGVEAETIKLVQAKLLTFRQIGQTATDVGGQFDQATQAALNLAAAGFGTAESNAVQLGKALQDPIKGITALARAGVTFTDEEKQKIRTLVESNKMLEAQDLILGALQGQVGGVAEATATATDRIRNGFGQVEDAIGLALLPAFEDFADYVSSEEFASAINDFARELDNFATGLGVIGDKIGSDVDEINGYLNNIGLDVDLNNFNKTISRFIPGLNILSAISNLGAAENLQEALNKGSGFNTTTLEGILKSSGGAFTAGTGTTVTKSTKGLTAAQKAAAAAAKAAAEAIKAATKAADEQAKAYMEAAEAAADFMLATRKMVAGFTELFKVTPELGQFEQATVDAFSNIFDTIDSALSDGMILSGAANALREYAASERKTLQAIAKQRDVLAGKIDVARTITAGVTGLLSITNLLETSSRSVTETVRSIVGGIDVAVTKTFDVVESGGLVDNFQKLVDKTKAFAKNLVALKKLGLNKQLFAQLVQAGADAGGATAEAIVAGGSDTISALNGLYNELALSASDIAANATDTLYEVGQQVVSNGFIEGLLSQESELQRAAQTLADAFASTFTTQLQLAVDAVLPQGSSMIDQVAAVNLAGGGVGGRGTAFNAASTGRATVFNVNVSAGVVTDPNGLARTVIDSVKKYERANGSVWVAA
jgi:hypothetical protein